MSKQFEFEGVMSSGNPLVCKNEIEALIASSTASSVPVLAWNNTDTYESGDIRSYAGLNYKTNTTVSAAEDPPDANTKWDRVYNDYYIEIYDPLNIYADEAIVGFTDSSGDFLVYQANASVAVGESPETTPSKWDIILASKAYVDGLIDGSAHYISAYNASTNSPDLDTSPSGIQKGDMYSVSTAGTFFTEALKAGDVIIAMQDNPTALTHWMRINKATAFGTSSGTIAEGNDSRITGAQQTSGKDATGGYAGLTLFKINFKNVANTYTSYLTNSNTASRTYTFPDRNGTIADDTDLALKLDKSGGTVTGNIQLAENISILSDDTLSADGKYCANVAYAGTLGETVAFGAPIYFKVADSKWYKTVDSAEATAGVKIGFCALAGNADDPTLIIKSGKIRADALFPTLTVGAKVYLSGTGNISSTKPTSGVVRCVGYANTADEIDIDISKFYDFVGTWTIGLTFGGASVGMTTSSNSGWYIKSNDKISCGGFIQLSAKGSSTGTANITGLPFTCKNGNAYYTGVSIHPESITYTGIIDAYVRVNSTLLDLFNMSEAGTSSVLTHTNFNNSSALILGFTYTI